MYLKKIIVVLMSLAFGFTPAHSAPTGPFHVEQGSSFLRLDDAVKALAGRNGTITISPGTYADCAVLRSGAVTFRAATPSTAIFDGGACDGKATLVLAGEAATVDGLVFQNVHVADRNGSGIRLEKGDLTVVRSTFRNSEQGILTNDIPGARIRVDHSTFSKLGGCPDGMCSHSIYIGPSAMLTVTRSRFEAGTGGHYVKARSARVSIENNSFDDSNGHATNYAIDLPNGATGSIANNMIVMGRDKENHSAVIAVAAERRANSSSGLTIMANDVRLAPLADYSTTFVADWSHDSLRIGPNSLGPRVKVSDTR